MRTLFFFCCLLLEALAIGRVQAQSLQSVYSFTERPFGGYQLGSVDSLEYDHLGRLSRRLRIGVAGGELWVVSNSHTYQYNNQQQLALEEYMVHHLPNPFDSAYRIAYAYDAAGRLTTATKLKVIDGVWQASEQAQYVYDAGGRLTDVIAQVQLFDTWRDVQHRRFQYDANGLMVAESLHRKGAADTLQRVEERFYTYDALQRLLAAQRLLYTVSDVLPERIEQETYFYNGNRLVADSLLRRIFTANDTTAWILTRQLLPNDSIDLVQTYALLPAGRRLVEYQNFRYGVAAGFEEPGALRFKAYPNPVINQLFVESDADLPAQLRLLNALGGSTKAWNITAGKNTLDLQGLPAGFYWLQIQSGGKTAIQKIVKE